MLRIDFFGREKELNAFNSLISRPQSDLTYVRGRRRIGKSSFLKKVQAQYPNCFYFQGADDSSNLSQKRRFAEKWTLFSGDSVLSDLRDSSLSWSRIFSEITDYVDKKQEVLIILLDEIQWISKKGSGFLGELKEIWLEWKASKMVKLILSGSSARFFEEHSEQHDSTLRGLKTSAEILLEDFTLREVEKYYFPDWTRQQIALTYMMLGGVPYYLEQIQSKLNYIQAINKAIFLSDTIFLNEVYQILNLEFSEASTENVLRILSSLKMNGASQSKIISSTGLPASTARDIIMKLLKYNIITQKNYKQVKGNANGTAYHMTDFYLNFYFQVLFNLSNRIKLNSTNGLLFADLISSKTGYYIPNFSGKAFENLVRSVLTNKKEQGVLIFEKLNLSGADYKVKTYHDKNTEIDLLVDNPLDREIRLLEIKWFSEQSRNWQLVFESINKKSCPCRKSYTLARYLVVATEHNPLLEKLGKQYNITVIYLSDLF